MFIAVQPMGGLGNLLYQHNCAYALAKKFNVGLTFVTDYVETRPNVKEYQKLFQHVQMVTNVQKDTKRVQEKSFCHDPSFCLFESVPFIIQGYFQSYKYSRHLRTEIRDLLCNNESEIITRMSKKIADIPGIPVCVHIRRGDYLQLSHFHTVLTELYYDQAIQHIPAHNSTLLVFAEDTSEIKHWSVWTKAAASGHNVYFVDDVPSAIDTLFMMSLCRHFIVANSSLSLSAYELRMHDDSILVAPSKWFGPCGPVFQIRDIVDETAILIDC